MSERLTLPQAILYPERPARRDPWLDRIADAALSLAAPYGTGFRAQRLSRILAPVADHAPRLRGLDDAGLRNEARAVRAALRARAEWAEADVAHALALSAEVAGRTIGLRPFDEQLLGAFATLRGLAVEMATGEGKTLAASLAAGIAALAGIPVHVVTVNRYLADRDAAQTRPLYTMLGLSCGVVTEAVPLPERAAQYRCDVTVCTNKDLPFDYMRDRLAMGRARSNLRMKAARITGQQSRPSHGTLLRGLHFAIVDEADSVLIDEARTPLILSAEIDDTRESHDARHALEIAAGLRAGRDFVVLSRERRVVLQEPAHRALASLAGRGAPWDSPAERERLVELALTALHTLRRDEHYLVRNGKAEIIDEFTGRIMPDRSWSDGLQDMVDCIEGLQTGPARAVVARTTYQRFYRRYRRLAGLSGTLREVAGELWRVYRLPVATVPLHRPDHKRFAAGTSFADAEQKWRTIAAGVATAHAAGRPVLIGTRTVEASLAAAAALAAQGVPHAVLNAAQDTDEAAIVAKAGCAGSVTVATNMAGRGTDIRLEADVVQMGGLTVIVSEPHEARRIDRQLIGRCGRQGDPGLVRRCYALSDPLLQAHVPWVLRAVTRRFPLRLRDAVVPVLARLAQRRAERLHARMRRDLLRAEEWLGDAIAFAGEEQ